MPNTTGKCPICGAQTDPQYAPFCSKHCADVDLGRWFQGTYVVHTNETPEAQEEVPHEEQK